MCGIVGFVGEDKRLLTRMLRQIQHRGPDDTAIFTDGKVSLGMQRLAILDLQKGIYPMQDKQRGIHLVFNGEIYNFKAIRAQLIKKGMSFRTNCDAEVILKAYIVWGVKAIRVFNGMFTIALYDEKKGKLLLIRDRLGIKPLYYYHTHSRFLFASEIKSLLEDGMKRRINANAQNLFLSQRYIPSNETIFQGIHKLPAGHLLIFDCKRHKAEVSKYWDIAYLDKPTVVNEGIASQRLSKLLTSAVKQRLISDVPLGAYLSGGIDSSAIVGLMRKIQGKAAKIKTFSVAFEMGDHVNELPFAKQVSEQFETDHTEFTITPNIQKILPRIVHLGDEPIADPAHIPVYLLSERAKKHITVVLTGDGADELFAGYDQYRLYASYAKKMRMLAGPLAGPLASTGIKIAPAAILNKVYKHAAQNRSAGAERVRTMLHSYKSSPAKSYYALTSIFSDKERHDLSKDKVGTEIEYESIDKSYFQSNSVLQNIQYHDVKRLLPQSFLMKTDRMTMAHGLEGRVPFLDHRIAEFAFTLDPRLRLHKGTTKYILKRALKDLLPKNILHRRKQVFHVPVESWITSALKEMSHDLLSKESMQGLNINYSQVKKIKAHYDAAPLYYGRQIWSLMNLSLWKRIYIDRRPVHLALRK